MSEERMLRILKASHVSEKASIVGDMRNQVVFRVERDATKPEVKAAVERLFGVNVRSVNVVNVPAKPKHFRQSKGSRCGWRKAYVSLAAGEEIDLMGGESHLG